MRVSKQVQRRWVYERFESTRDVWDVLDGEEDGARPIVEACMSGNNTALQSLLSQPQFLQEMIEKPLVSRSSSVGNIMIRVKAQTMRNSYPQRQYHSSNGL